jgi:dTDP-4-dehydrorhamnose reductase
VGAGALSQSPTVRSKGHRPTGPQTVVVTGAAGFLGSTLLSEYPQLGLNLVACDMLPINSGYERVVQADLLSSEGMSALASVVAPDAWVVNCVAATDVNWCEKNPDKAHYVNAELPGTLARMCAERGARLVQISTDSVFDGTTGLYGEEASPGPLNVYARTKWEGEKAVLAAGGSALVVRTNIVGWSAGGERGLTEWILGRLSSSVPVPGFSDVFFNPILTNDLGRILLELIEARAEGVLHVAGEDVHSKYEYARSLARTFGYDEALVLPTEVADVGFAAERPMNPSLATDKVSDLLGRAMPTLSETLGRLAALKESGWVERLKQRAGGG